VSARWSLTVGAVGVPRPANLRKLMSARDPIAACTLFERSETPRQRVRALLPAALIGSGYLMAYGAISRTSWMKGRTAEKKPAKPADFRNPSRCPSVESHSMRRMNDFGSYERRAPKRELNHHCVRSADRRVRHQSHAWPGLASEENL
jgi:hypothetical protein